MSEACHTAVHHRMIKTPFGKLLHCLREQPLLKKGRMGKQGEEAVVEEEEGVRRQG